MSSRNGSTRGSVTNGDHDTRAVRLRLLKTFELTLDGAPVEVPPSAQRVAAFIALADRPLLRIYVAGTLWLDANEQHSRANLRSALWRLRRTGFPLVEATSESLRLDAGVGVDVHDTVRLAHRLIGGPADARDDALGNALADDLLPDWYDDWVQIERERLRLLRLHALEALAERLLEAGRYGEAADACLVAVHADPLRESAHRILIRLCFAEGNWGEALRQYNLYARRLHKELGLRPSPQIEQLLAELPRASRGAGVTGAGGPRSWP